MKQHQCIQLGNLNIVIKINNIKYKTKGKFENYLEITKVVGLK